MKVRWTRDSIRLRISPSELDVLGRGEVVHEGIAFPGGLFWNVTLRPGVDKTILASDEHTVYLSLTRDDRDTLAQPETEGIYFQWDGPQPLRCSVEKDFPCVHPRAAQAHEPVTQTFEAPPGFAERKSERDTDGK